MVQADRVPAVRAEQSPAPQSGGANESAAVLSMLERVAADPAQSVERLEQMFALYQKVEADKSRKAFMTALVKVQADMEPIVKDKDNQQTRSKYATHAALDAVLRPVYVKHGFAPTFTTDDCPTPDAIRVVCDLVHQDGHERRYQVDMPADGKGAKGGDVMTKTHAAGAAMNYGKRYLLIAIFNLAFLEKDADGNVPKLGPTITPKQVAELEALLDATASDKAAFLKIGNVDGLHDIPADKFLSAKGMLMKKLAPKK